MKAITEIAHLARTFKRAQRGLYAGERIKFADRVTEFGNRTRYTIKPNVQRVSLWSETLQEKIKLSVTESALGLIDKSGGLDNYIVEQRHSESLKAEQLKRKILLKRLENEKNSIVINKASPSSFYP